MYKFPLKKIKTWSQSKISPYCFVFGVNQEYLEVEGSQTFSCVTPVVETFSLHRVAFRAQSNINEGATLQKQPTALTRWLPRQKDPNTDLRPDSKYGSNWRCYEWGEWADCRCMEYVDASWCTRKWLRLYQTIRNLTSGDLGILLMVIRLGGTGLRKAMFVYLLELFKGRGDKGQCVLVYVERL